MTIYSEHSRILSTEDSAILREISDNCTGLTQDGLEAAQIFNLLMSLEGNLVYFENKLSMISIDKLFAFEDDLANFQQFVDRLEATEELIVLKANEEVLSKIEHITALFERIIQELSDAKAGQE
jgi:hypothetical protein